jgi:hypothetical protein
MTVLFDSKYIRLTVDDPPGIVRFIRHQQPFEDLEVAKQVFRTALEHLSALPRGRYALLSDLRAVVGRNDEAFERATHEARRDLFSLFRKRAAIVRTTAGVLQIKRLGREQKTSVTEAFESEDEALAYLQAP